MGTTILGSYPSAQLSIKSWKQATIELIWGDFTEFSEARKTFSKESVAKVLEMKISNIYTKNLCEYNTYWHLVFVNHHTLNFKAIN